MVRAYGYHDQETPSCLNHHHQALLFFFLKTDRIAHRILYHHIYCFLQDQPVHTLRHEPSSQLTLNRFRNLIGSDSPNGVPNHPSISAPRRSTCSPPWRSTESRCKFLSSISELLTGEGCFRYRRNVRRTNTE